MFETLLAGVLETKSKVRLVRQNGEMNEGKCQSWLNGSNEELFKLYDFSDADRDPYNLRRDRMSD